VIWVLVETIQNMVAVFCGKHAELWALEVTTLSLLNPVLNMSNHVLFVFFIYTHWAFIPLSFDMIKGILIKQPVRNWKFVFDIRGRRTN
jgi:hypothetical protein